MTQTLVNNKLKLFRKNTMSSIYYDISTQPKNFSELFQLRASSQTEIQNELGCFVVRNDHPQHDIGKTNYGVVLLDGFPWIGSEHQTAQSIAEKLTDDVAHNKEVIRSLRGQPAIIYVTEEHVMFSRCGAPTKNLSYFYEPDDKTFTVTTFNTDLQSRHGNYMRVREGLLYTFDKHNFNMQIEQFVTWNFTQYRTNWDRVFETYEHVIRMNHHAGSLYTLSSGIDSGVIDCALHNQNIEHHVCHIMTAIEEDREILNQRLRLNDKKHVHLIRATENSENPAREPYFEWCMMRDGFTPSPNQLIFADSHELMYNKICKPLGLYSVVQGQGGDNLFADHGFRGRRARPISLFGGVFPANLEEVWSEAFGIGRDVRERLDVLWGIHGIDISYPLLDQDLIQDFLNTSRELKNSRYKNWESQYMADSNYPYTNAKGGWGGWLWSKMVDMNI
jgi:asparagine synthetase B (glutamine-hydrolysing)